MLMRWDPFVEGTRLEAELARSYGAALRKSFEPAVDIFDEDEAIVLHAEVPGMSSGELDVQVEGSLLTLSGQRKLERESTQGRAHRRERIPGAFRRSFMLPKTVDGDAIHASLKDGVLTLRIPKKNAPDRRRIEVKSDS